MHDNLKGAVTGLDSLGLMKLCPELKPCSVMTLREFVELPEAALSDSYAYILLMDRIFVINADICSYDEAVKMLESGRISELLGYPSDRNGMTVIVTKDGRVESNPDVILDEIIDKNIIWGAEGKGVMEYAERIADAVKGAIYA